MINRTKIDSASTLELLIELMYNGKAEIVPELAHLEPIPVEDIADILTARYRKTFGTDFSRWYAWFISKDCSSSEEEKDILVNLKSFKDETGELLKRIREQQSPNDS